MLGFNTTSFYKWKKTPRSARERYDTVLLAEIREIHADDPEFGYRFIWDELKQRGHQVAGIVSSGSARPTASTPVP